MSFQQKNFWMPRDAVCVTNEEMSYANSSKMEPKRSHQWFIDTPGPELLNKRQAVEGVDDRPIAGVSQMNLAWENASSFQSFSGQFSDRLFGSEPMRSVSSVNRIITPASAGDASLGRKCFDDQFRNDSSVSLSMCQSHGSEDPSSFLNFGGIRKVKVNQVREADNSMPATLGNPYRGNNNSTLSVNPNYHKVDSNIISLAPAYSNREGNNISGGAGFSKEGENFISMAHPFSKEDGNFISMGQNYSRGNDNILSMGQPFTKGGENLMSIGREYTKGNDVVPMGSSYNKEHGNFISMNNGFGKESENFSSFSSSFNKGNNNVMPMGHTYEKASSNVVSVASTYEKGDSNILTMSHTYKGENTTISFGGFDEEVEANTSGAIIGNYEIVLDNEKSAQGSEVPSPKDDSGADLVVSSSASSKAVVRAENPPKNREPKMAKKLPPNNFPSNVKSLLSTGMLDEVPVRYVSWSREKNLRGVIKGTGYLCSCKECNNTKALNAYEFERHAGCKTKHPNNHIYFDNGKTIYAVVQELKNTPQETLFDAIQTVTGSPIHQKNFRLWKASYQAATRELQRIYGKDEVKMPS